MRNEVNRAHKAKTTLRYLLSLIAILSVVSVAAATFGKPYQPQRQGAQYANYSQMPTLSMGSTSSAMMQSGSALPMAAVSGTTSADDYAPSSGPRRAKKEGEGFADEDDTPGQGDSNPDLPGDTVPIGDAAVPMMLLACAYLGMRVYLRRKRALKG